MVDDWTIGVVAETIGGNVVLKMTQEQARDLSDRLRFLLGVDDD